MVSTGKVTLAPVSGAAGGRGPWAQWEMFCRCDPTALVVAAFLGNQISRTPFFSTHIQLCGMS